MIQNCLWGRFFLLVISEVLITEIETKPRIRHIQMNRGWVSREDVARIKSILTLVS